MFSSGWVFGCEGNQRLVLKQRYTFMSEDLTTKVTKDGTKVTKIAEQALCSLRILCVPCGL